MRFFTMEWWQGLQEGVHPDAPERYRAYVDSIRERLPASVIALDEANLHDGLVRSIRVDGTAAQVELRADLCEATGLIPFAATFEGVKAVRFVSDPDRSLPGPGGFGDLGYWEVDIVEDAFEFRALFSTGVEMAILFADVAITTG